MERWEILALTPLDKLNFIMNYEGYGVEDVNYDQGFVWWKCIYEVGYMTYFYSDYAWNLYVHELWFHKDKWKKSLY